MTAINTLNDEELAALITGFAIAAHPANMDAAEEFALRMVDGILLGVPPAGTVGPDYDTETETAWQAQRDLADQEAGL
jgi:hypothetical protein